MKKVLKYGTGDTIPKDAEYLCTIKNGDMAKDYKYVWHYFLVEVKE